jgi:hypothetical protein
MSRSAAPWCSARAAFAPWRLVSCAQPLRPLLCRVHRLLCSCSCSRRPKMTPISRKWTNGMSPKDRSREMGVLPIRSAAGRAVSNAVRLGGILGRFPTSVPTWAHRTPASAGPSGIRRPHPASALHMRSVRPRFVASSRVRYSPPSIRHSPPPVHSSSPSGIRRPPVQFGSPHHPAAAVRPSRRGRSSCDRSRTRSPHRRRSEPGDRPEVWAMT